jgi:hypothetical protein
MSTLVIEKGIQAPAREDHSGLKAQLEKLNVGDSFKFATSKLASLRTVASKAGAKIVSEKIESTEETRVWITGKREVTAAPVEAADPAPVVPTPVAAEAPKAPAPAKPSSAPAPSAAKKPATAPAKHGK